MNFQGSKKVFKKSDLFFAFINVPNMGLFLHAVNRTLFYVICFKNYSANTELYFYNLIREKI